MESKSMVSINTKACPICGNEHDVGILLEKRLQKVFDKHTVTGYQVCDECNGKRKKYVAMIVIDIDKSTTNGETITIEDAYRTGEILWIKYEVYDEIFDKPHRNGMGFIDEQAAVKLKSMIGG